MPKVLITEKDRTSSGTPDSYRNFAVLIPGFLKTTFTEKDKKEGITLEYLTKNRENAVDANGMYEFDDIGDFENVIGLVAPRIETADGDVYHYGNQMAYELLKMGYSIVYMPIKSLDDLKKTDKWDIFKDKANYDFRFITHGLLSVQEYDYAEEYKAAEVVVDELQNRKDELIAATDLLESIKNIIGKNYSSDNAELYENIYASTIYNEISADGIVEATDYIALAPKYKGLVTKQTEAGDEGNTVTTYTVYSTYREAIVDTALEDDTVDGGAVALELVQREKDLAEAKEHLESLKSKKTTGSFINTVNEIIAGIACHHVEAFSDGRGDCIALIELDEATYKNTDGTDQKPETRIINAINDMGINEYTGPYCALTVPSVEYSMKPREEFADSEGVVNKRFPGAFHYLACFMSSMAKGFKEWYATAGYTRGVSSYVIDHTSVKLGEIAVNALEPRNYESGVSYPKFSCNVIANFRGSYYLWGNRTAYPIGSAEGGEDLVASHFLNIRQLCTTIKKQLYSASRRYTFDPNSDTLWYNFVNAIKPTLETMKADQGIRDYKILKVFTDKKATFKAKIRIIPIEAVEDFDLEVSLEDSFEVTE